MNAEQIEKHWKASPFRPFRVYVADGRNFNVPHRDFMWRHPAGRSIFIAAGEDAYEVIDMLMITTLSIGNGSSSGAKNEDQQT